MYLIVAAIRPREIEERKIQLKHFTLNLLIKVRI